MTTPKVTTQSLLEIEKFPVSAQIKQRQMQAGELCEASSSLFACTLQVYHRISPLNYEKLHVDS